MEKDLGGKEFDIRPNFLLTSDVSVGVVCQFYKLVLNHNTISI